MLYYYFFSFKSYSLFKFGKATAIKINCLGTTEISRCVCQAYNCTHCALCACNESVSASYFCDVRRWTVCLMCDEQVYGQCALCDVSRWIMCVLCEEQGHGQCVLCDVS
jgi:hypothetical protein